MKHYLYCCLCLVLLCACRKTPFIENRDPQNATLPAFIKFTIPQNAHYSTGNTFKAISKKEVRFTAVFDSSCKYKNLLKENSGDINKLYGFSDCASDHHTSSARFGWVSLGDSIELHAYVYINGERKSKALDTVALNEEISLSITVSGFSYVFGFNGKTVSMPRQCNTDKIEGYHLYPYFGGDETAPHEMHILIREK